MADEVKPGTVAVENIDPSQLGGGMQAPVDTGTGARPKGGDDEEHGQPLAKAPSEKKVETPAEKPVVPADEDEVDDSWKTQYIEMPDAAGQSVINLLKAEGIKPVEANAIFEKALKSGDLKDVQWDVLVARLGEDKAALARIGIESHYEKVYKANVEVVNTVHAEVGGEPNWIKISTWAKAAEKKDPALKAEIDDIRLGIDAGGRSAKYAARDLKALYERAPGNNGLGVAKITQGTQPAPSGESPLSRRDYMAAMHKAEAENAKPAVIAALRARRQAGMQQGL